MALQRPRRSSRHLRRPCTQNRRVSPAVDRIDSSRRSSLPGRSPGHCRLPLNAAQAGAKRHWQCQWPGEVDAPPFRAFAPAKVAGGACQCPAGCRFGPCPDPPPVGSAGSCCGGTTTTSSPAVTVAVTPRPTRRLRPLGGGVGDRTLPVPGPVAACHAAAIQWELGVARVPGRVPQASSSRGLARPLRIYHGIGAVGRRARGHPRQQ